MLDRNAWKKRLKAVLSLDAHPGHIAAAFAIGVFISFTPLFSIHTGMAIVAAFLFRLNKIACITGAWVNTPLTVLPILVLSYKLGCLLLGLPPIDLRISVSELSWDLVSRLGLPLFLGSTILGAMAAAISYGVIYWLVVRFRRKDEALAELTREMVEVGEDIEP